VLVNLTVNARDAMPDGGELTIDCRNVEVRERDAATAFLAPGNWVKMEFCDTGIGMDETVMDHIFEPFFTTKELGRGTGLGLATVYGIVQQSGGVIRVWSEVGKGSRFELYFRSAVEVSRRPAIATPTDVRGTEGVLLVEDDESVRSMMVSGLRRFGYPVHAAASPDEALRLLPTLDRKVRLLITDVVLPGMNGRELSERVRDCRPDISVLFVSGYNDDAVLRRGIAHSDMDILPKPFTPRDLAVRVREILRRTVQAD
jgi:CheY-like chemotaxis protein